ncbi:MAG: ATP-dependent DNA helicase UvrD2 [Thermoleophilia bacterium]
MDRERILEGLNPEQREAAEAVRGPVVILAGAGSGKTTTITRRIALQVATGTFAPTEILAVTFTDKAAGELRERLARLGVERVPARTFHAAALAQLRALSGDPPGELLSSKALMLRQIANALPGAYRFRPAGDLATEVEWARNRRIPPQRYLDELGDHEPPIPPDLMLRVYREYERRKAERGLLDFEDLLERTVRMYDEDAGAVATFRGRYRAFTVDEFQDVNLLQRELLDRWLGERDDVCVVGDDYQSIYGFTGASPAHLLDMRRRYPHATVVRLERNYRSSPQVLAFANRLVPKLGGIEKRLAPTRPDGPEPELVPCAGVEEEGAFLVGWARRLAAEGVPLEEVAILYRTNARSEDVEEALASAGVPYQVRGGAVLARPAARRVRGGLSREPDAPAGPLVRRLAVADGWTEQVPEGVGDQEATRQADLARLVALAEGFEGDAAGFATDLRARFGGEGAGRGVQLLTLHRSKGLEFDAVAIVRVEEGELPIRQAKTEELIAEERRLLYVGLTRARRHLALTWLQSRKPSRFLKDLGVGRVAAAAASRPLDAEDEPALAALKAWRKERARADGVPAYVVFHDRTLEEIARRAPRDRADLSTISGIGPAKLERYADEVLAALVGD